MPRPTPEEIRALMSDEGRAALRARVMATVRKIFRTNPPPMPRRNAAGRIEDGAGEP